MNFVTLTTHVECHFQAHISTVTAQRRPYSSSESHKYSYEITNDPEEWKFVERLLPPRFIPSPPHDQHSPTPSGWVPPDSKYNELNDEHNLHKYYTELLMDVFNIQRA